MLAGLFTERDGERGQLDNINLVGVLFAIILTAAIAMVGTAVIGQIDDSTDVDTADAQTVVNETFNKQFSDTALYTVDAEKDPALEDDDDVQGDFKDDEVVFRLEGSDTELTEGTDYEWFTSNGTVKLYNTSATQGSDDDPSGNYSITYNYTDEPSEYGTASTAIAGGFSNAMSLTDIVFLVLMFVVIIGALFTARSVGKR